MSRSLVSVTRPLGFRAAGGGCGIKASGSPDLALIACEVPAVAAAVFTTNAVVGAPVIVGRRHVRCGRLRAIVCHSGVANVATGQAGVDDAMAMCRAAAEQVGGTARQVLPASTGVIGQRLPIDKIIGGIAALGPTLGRGAKADAGAAWAITTTDTRPKAALRQLKLGSATVQIGGIAKGSGMIAPNMATMLAFITTDAHITPTPLRRALKEAVNADASFNRITVDSDTSTSDTVAVLASGLAGHRRIDSTGAPGYGPFAEALTALCKDLAYQVIADGEGAEHVIRVTVTGAKSKAEALRAARTIADSPLVKTAVHGADPNWGRIAAAAGRSGAAVDPAKMTIRIGRTTVYRQAGPAKFDPHAVSKTMRRSEVPIAVSLGLGKARAEVLGCDLGREYVTINADYHT